MALVATALLVVSCGGTSAPAPSTTPAGEDRYVIDPRTGFGAPPNPAIEKRFDAAWRQFLAGNYPEARRRLAEVRAQNPEYLPAALAEAAVDLKQGDLAAARTIVQRVEDQSPDSVAARVYDAEIAIAERHDRIAYDTYRALARRPDAPPRTAERVSMLQTRVFEELFTSAQTAPEEESIRLLREALDINPGALNARVMLANKLIARHQLDEARQILDPVVSSPDFDTADVQQALAEIEIGRGQYQEAIARYDRLARRDPRYTARLEEIKEQWNAANMPPQYQQAIESQSIDRSGLAVLAYWKLTSVRFAQNLSTPPIAIDIEAIPGREEIIRAIAIGWFDVDPVTRRVSPARTVSAAALERLAAKLLIVRGAGCARAVPIDQVLTACGISDPFASLPPDSPVTGRQAAGLLDQIEKALR